MLDTMSTVVNFDVRWCTIICSGSVIVTGGARHRAAVLRQLQVVSVLTGLMPDLNTGLGYKRGFSVTSCRPIGGAQSDIQI